MGPDQKGCCRKKGPCVLLGVVLVLGLLFFGKNVIFKAAIESGAKFATGFPLHIDHFDMKFLKGSVKIDGFELQNPSRFEEKVFVSIPEIFVDVEPASILKASPHVRDVTLYLKEFNVVRNKEGALNLDALKAVAASKKTASQPSSQPASTSPSKKFGLKIDHLKLKIDRVAYKDLSGKTPSQTININLNEEFSNIGNINALVSLIVMKAMMSSSLASLANFDLGSLQGSVANLMASSTQMANDALGKAQTQANALTGGLTGELTGQLASVAGNLKAKLPSFKLGSKKEE